jgi:hypothetical protein
VRSPQEIARKLGIPFKGRLCNASLDVKKYVVEFVAFAIQEYFIIVKENQEMKDPVSGLIRHVSGADVKVQILQQAAMVRHDGSFEGSIRDVNAGLGEVPCMSQCALECFEEFQAEIQAAVAEPTPPIRPLPLHLVVPIRPVVIPNRTFDEAPPTRPAPTPSTRLLNDNPNRVSPSTGNNPLYDEPHVIVGPLIESCGVIVASALVTASSIVAIGALWVALSTEMITTGMCSVDDSPTICKLFLGLAIIGALGILSVIGFNVHIFVARKTVHNACYGVALCLAASLVAAGFAIAISVSASDAKNVTVEALAIAAAVLWIFSGCCCVPFVAMTSFE